MGRQPRLTDEEKAKRRREQNKAAQARHRERLKIRKEQMNGDFQGGPVTVVNSEQSSSANEAVALPTPEAYDSTQGTTSQDDSVIVVEPVGPYQSPSLFGWNSQDGLANSSLGFPAPVSSHLDPDPNQMPLFEANNFCVAPPSKEDLYFPDSVVAPDHNMDIDVDWDAADVNFDDGFQALGEFSEYLSSPVFSNKLDEHHEETSASWKETEARRNQPELTILSHLAREIFTREERDLFDDIRDKNLGFLQAITTYLAKIN